MYEIEKGVVYEPRKKASDVKAFLEGMEPGDSFRFPVCDFSVVATAVKHTNTRGVGKYSVLRQTRNDRGFARCWRLE